MGLHAPAPLQAFKRKQALEAELRQEKEAQQ